MKPHSFAMAFLGALCVGGIIIVARMPTAPPRNAEAPQVWHDDKNHYTCWLAPRGGIWCEGDPNLATTQMWVEGQAWRKDAGL